MMKQPQQDSSIPIHPAIFRIMLCALALTACPAVTAAEVYTWTDENGVVHFSDAPPESGESARLEVEEIYRPGSVEAQPTPSDAPAEAAEHGGEPEAEPPLTAAQQRREQILRDRAERQEEATETERLCGLHRQRLEQMEPARRVFYTDESGESVRMDDDRRMALIDESKQFLADNCRG
jgi:hypothetical protein